jgi:hypothetical protein
MKSNAKIRIESAFDFNEKVRITPLKVEGTIESFWLKKGDELKIEVRYFLKDEIKFDYFYGDELEVVKEVKTGFSI